MNLFLFAAEEEVNVAFENSSIVIKTFLWHY